MDDASRFMPSQSTLPLADDFSKSSAMKEISVDNEPDKALPIETTSSAITAPADIDSGTTAPLDRPPRRKKARRELPLEWLQPVESGSGKKRKRTTGLPDDQSEDKKKTEILTEPENTDAQRTSRSATQTNKPRNKVISFVHHHFYQR